MKRLCVWIALAGMAGAASAATLSAGTQELRLQGTIDPSTADGGELNLNVSYGYFFEDNVQAGGRVSYLDNDRVSAVGLGGYVEINFPTESEVLPFVEGYAGISDVDVQDANSATAGIVEGRVGAKFFLAENVAIAAAGVFAWATDDIYADEDQLDDTDAFLELSLRSYF